MARYYLSKDTKAEFHSKQSYSRDTLGPVNHGLKTRWAMASILVVSVSLLFFFPSPVGGFQASHGPTTTLKEHNTGFHFEILISASALINAIAALPRFETSCLTSFSSGPHLWAGPNIHFNLLRC